jgi:biopolymer transport protein ExbB
MNQNAYTITHLWEQSDFITHSVAMILIFMSIISWTVIVSKAINILKLQKMADQAHRFWHTTSFDQAVTTLEPRHHNPFRTLATVGSEAASHHTDSQNELHGILNISDWLTSCLRQSIDETTSKLQSGLSVLASVGSTAPFIGLFGTVWGIYHALIAISVSGDAGIDKVAGPVGESLIMTALGLAVAIPAVLGYNALIRGNKGILARLKHFAHDLHAYLVTGKPVSAGTPSQRVI